MLNIIEKYHKLFHENFFSKSLVCLRIAQMSGLDITCSYKKEISHNFVAWKRRIGKQLKRRQHCLFFVELKKLQIF
jgi:hypothetical protein